MGRSSAIVQMDYGRRSAVRYCRAVISQMQRTGPFQKLSTNFPTISCCQQLRLTAVLDRRIDSAEQNAVCNKI